MLDSLHCDWCGRVLCEDPEACAYALEIERDGQPWETPCPAKDGIMCGDEGCVANGCEELER